MNIQDILVGVIVGIAIAWCAFSFYRQITGKKKCNCAGGCGHCNGCAQKRNNEDI